MDAGKLVVISCASPKEKFWGLLLALSPTGVTFRGIAVETFEDFLRQYAGEAQVLIGAMTVFVPLHRIERIELDESAGVVEGLADRFARVVRRDPRRELLGEAAADGTDTQM
jgi:hypothetical protein